MADESDPLLCLAYGPELTSLPPQLPNLVQPLLKHGCSFVICYIFATRTFLFFLDIILMLKKRSHATVSKNESLNGARYWQKACNEREGIPVSFKGTFTLEQIESVRFHAIFWYELPSNEDI